MKRCTHCGQAYTDETLNFCLTDGRPLVHEGAAPTAVLTHPVVTPRRRRIWLPVVVVLGVLALMVIAGVAGALISQKISRQNERAAVTPARSPTANSPRKPAATPAQTSGAIDTDATPGADSEDDDGSETTPISWDTMGSNFEGSSGKTYRFVCPPNGVVGSIFGSDVYADYSSICTAAVHTGLITLIDGGEVEIEYKPGRALYGSTERNGIKSYTAAKHDRSFVVK